MTRSSRGLAFTVPSCDLFYFSGVVMSLLWFLSFSSLSLCFLLAILSVLSVLFVFSNTQLQVVWKFSCFFSVSIPALFFFFFPARLVFGLSFVLVS